MTARFYSQALIRLSLALLLLSALQSKAFADDVTKVEVQKCRALVVRIADTMDRSDLSQLKARDRISQPAEAFNDDSRLVVLSTAFKDFVPADFVAQLSQWAKEADVNVEMGAAAMHNIKGKLSFSFLAYGKGSKLTDFISRVERSAADQEASLSVELLEKNKRPLNQNVLGGGHLWTFDSRPDFKSSRDESGILKAFDDITKGELGGFLDIGTGQIILAVGADAFNRLNPLSRPQTSVRPDSPAEFLLQILSFNQAGQGHPLSVKIGDQDVFFVSSKNFREMAETYLQQVKDFEIAQQRMTDDDHNLLATLFKKPTGDLQKVQMASIAPPSPSSVPAPLSQNSSVVEREIPESGDQILVADLVNVDRRSIITKSFLKGADYLVVKNTRDKLRYLVVNPESIRTHGLDAVKKAYNLQRDQSEDIPLPEVIEDVLERFRLGSALSDDILLSLIKLNPPVGHSNLKTACNSEHPIRVVMKEGAPAMILISVSEPTSQSLSPALSQVMIPSRVAQSVTVEALPSQDLRAPQPSEIFVPAQVRFAKDFDLPKETQSSSVDLRTLMNPEQLNHIFSVLSHQRSSLIIDGLESGERYLAVSPKRMIERGYLPTIQELQLVSGQSEIPPRIVQLLKSYHATQGDVGYERINDKDFAEMTKSYFSKMSQYANLTLIPEAKNFIIVNSEKVGRDGMILIRLPRAQVTKDKPPLVETVPEVTSKVTTSVTTPVTSGIQMPLNYEPIGAIGLFERFLTELFNSGTPLKPEERSELEWLLHTLKSDAEVRNQAGVLIDASMKEYFDLERSRISVDDQQLVESIFNEIFPSIAAVDKGLETLGSATPQRAEEISVEPFIVISGAKNPERAKIAASKLSKLFEGKSAEELELLKSRIRFDASVTDDLPRRIPGDIAEKLANSIFEVLHGADKSNVDFTITGLKGAIFKRTAGNYLVTLISVGKDSKGLDIYRVIGMTPFGNAKGVYRDRLRDRAQ